MIHSA